jgi:hypothetical protein
LRFLLIIYFILASLLARDDPKCHKSAQQFGLFNIEIGKPKKRVVPNVGSPSYEQVSTRERGESLDTEAQASGIEKDSKSRSQNVQSASGSCELS